MEIKCSRIVSSAMAAAIALASCLSPVAAIDAHALTLPKGYGLSKKDAKGYGTKNMWKKIKTPKRWRTKVKVKSKKFRRLGIVCKYGKEWTWYSQRVLPGYGLKIKGRHLNENGYVVNWRGQIVLASSEYRRGTVMRTPFGADGIVLDDGCWGSVDVYTGW